MKNSSLLACGLLLFACSKDPAKDAPPTPTNSASAAAPAGTTSAVPVTPPSTTAPAGSALAADGTGALVLSWKVANAPQEMVIVSLVAGDQTFSLGKLSAASDEAPGTVETCAMKNTGTNDSRLSCGMTPHYNFYTAKISGGALVVSLTDGVDNDPPGSETVTEVLKKPTTATALKATGPASKALFGNCRAGFVQKGPDKPCMRQCLKGTGCTATAKCELTAVQGTDGPHKVSACVPK